MGSGCSKLRTSWDTAHAHHPFWTGLCMDRQDHGKDHSNETQPRVPRVGTHKGWTGFVSHLACSFLPRCAQAEAQKCLKTGRGHSKVTNSAGTGQLALRRRLWQGQQQGLGATPFSGARWGFQRDCWAWVPLSIGSTDWDGERACGSRGGGDFAEGRIGVCSCSLASWVQRTDSRSSAHPCPFLLYWIGPPSAAKP